MAGRHEQMIAVLVSADVQMVTSEFSSVGSISLAVG